MLKKIIFMAILGLAAFLGAQIGQPTSVLAQDIWIYSSDGGVAYYVQDETVIVKPRTGGQYQATLKTVEDGFLVDRTTWLFNHDEGYVWAMPVGHPHDAFAIYAEANHYGDAPVLDRPWLLALYNWLQDNSWKYR